MTEAAQTLKARLEEARKARVARQAQRDKARKELDRLASRIQKVQTNSDKAREAIAANVLADVLDGLDPRPVDPVLAETARRAEVMGTASAEAMRLKSAELASAEAALSEADATFAGAVFGWVGEVQAEALSDLLKLWPTMAPALARLTAINAVRDRYCSASMKLTGIGAERPWSGSALVSKLIAGIPPRLNSPALGRAQLDALTKPIVESLISEVEGA